MKRKSAKQGRRLAVKPQRLLVAIDFSTPSECALHHAAVKLAAQSGGSLILLHVVPANYGWLGIGRDESRDLDRSLQRQAADRLRAFANENVAHNVAADLEVRIGRPAEEIVAAATGSKCDAIVLSTRGLTGLDRFLIGSVADRVARLSSCPIFLIPTTKRSLPRKQERPPVLRFKREGKRPR